MGWSYLYDMPRRLRDDGGDDEPVAEDGAILVSDEDNAIISDDSGTGIDLGDQ